ncbi:MAG: rhomboid family intramembrane serine protease [Actinomycetota bacterium]
MAQEPPPYEAPPLEACYRHPNVGTRVHCTRCGRPICPECMIPAPVGYQCPECVEQARREFRAGPQRRARQAATTSPTKIILAAIAAMFVVELVRSGGGGVGTGPSLQTLVDLGAMFPPAVAAGQYWRLFTSMFLHAGILHIAFNGYALWIFGPVVEEEFGRIRFVLIYFLSGFLAGVASYTFGPPVEVGVGASGAIVGVFGAFIAFNFRRRHLGLARARLRMAATLIVINAVIALAIPSIDWRAHVGGLVAGFATGLFAEGFGKRSTRVMIQVAGFAALTVAGIALLIWRTEQLRELLAGTPFA